MTVTAGTIAAGMIRRYDERIADIFEARPAGRLHIAHAFARAAERIDGHDAHYAATIVALAEIDQNG
jgi:hypothetical protein